MPLVRYRTGDLIRVPSNYGAQELEEVAAGKRSFPEILGRDLDYAGSLNPNPDEIWIERPRFIQIRTRFGLSAPALSKSGRDLD